MTMQRIWDWLLSLQQARLVEGEWSVRLTHLWPVWLAPSSGTQRAICQTSTLASEAVMVSGR